MCGKNRLNSHWARTCAWPLAVGENTPVKTDPSVPTAAPTTEGPQAHPACGPLTVMFDGSCPLCQREIGVYQSLTPLQPVAWMDVSAVDLTPEARARLMARFHVQPSEGPMLSGAAAFVALWLTLPGWRWLGRLGRLPWMTPLMEVAYRAFLKIRPGLQRWLLTRSAPSSSAKTP